MDGVQGERVGAGSQGSWVPTGLDITAAMALTFTADMASSFGHLHLAPTTFLSRYPMFLAVPKSYHLLRSLQSIQPYLHIAWHPSTPPPGFSQKSWWKPPCPRHSQRTQTMNAKILGPAQVAAGTSWTMASATTGCLGD